MASSLAPTSSLPRECHWLLSVFSSALPLLGFRLARRLCLRLLAMVADTLLSRNSYACTWGPVSWVYPPELMPNRLRAKSNSLSTAGNWIFNFALSYFVPPAFKVSSKS